MTRAALLLVLAACPAPPQERLAPAGHLPNRSTTPPPRGAQEGGILSQLDAIDARIQALAYPDPAHCQDACLTGVQSVELKRGVVSCRCRKVPSLGVYRMAKEGR